MYLLYLYDPHANTLSLKPNVMRILKMPPEEQDGLEKYIKTNICSTKEWGAYIGKAPAGIVAPYAIGDVDRTLALYEYLKPIIENDGMLPAYQREQRLMPILEAASQQGILVNVN